MSGTRWSGPFVAGALSLLFFAALFLVPLLGGFIGLLAPVPLVREVGLGRPGLLAWGWVLVVLVGAAVVFPRVETVLLAAGYLLLAAWPTFLVEHGQRRPRAPGRWLAFLTLGAWSFASVVVAGLVGFSRVQEQLPALAVSWAQEHGQAAALWTLGRPEVLQLAASLAGYLTPFLVAVYVMTAGLWLRAQLSQLGFSPKPEPFLRFTSEEWLPVGFILGGLGWVFAPGVWGWLAANLFATVLALYFVHGTAVILAFLGPRWGTSRWVRMAVVVLGIQVPLAFVYAGLGLLDSFVKLRPKEDHEGGAP
ncbi:MAG: YybS family protein [Thermoanaerobaculum sp.]|nr:YybS family protein [Thermoanaerobaculum sp.]